MAKPFTIGIEEEFQLVDRQTGQLYPGIQTVLEHGQAIFGEQIKAEMLQPTVELISEVLPDIPTARKEMRTARAKLARLVGEEGLALISAGTHPTALWQEQPKTPHERYNELEEEYQDVARSILIFGLHVHVGVEKKEMAVTLMNQLRTWLPHLLALSTNSPFWAGRHTGLKSYRSVVWKPFPRSGIPEVFPSWNDFDAYVQALIKTGSIDNGKKIWWDIRPHPFFNTVEFRIFDMPGTVEYTIAIAALCQALVAKLTRLNKAGLWTPMLSSHFIEENKWHAMRSGLDAEVIDYVQGRRHSMRESISELLDFVDDVIDDLGSRPEIDHLRGVLEDKHGTGADQQIAIYQETGNLDDVVQFLMQQTMKGIQESWGA
ncbi:MAG TPA: carboxylate-amine ligase [Ktedonobacter sp.]|jgi:carboxylate-amine ligase|nr:carboxylate-amine ligase [Ktedonobacter sp.]HBE25830.1 carboxylate-amine ligase [Ktedonobacter sp.]HBE27533.1 carboxylate-amine ligase [Ktedonobacter sp.]HCJ36345.1 carboxylate-amine ligase [Ktedonobacter sp.]